MAFIQQMFGSTGMAEFVKLNNIEKVNEHTLDAQVEKALSKTRLGLKDAIKLMEKHGIFERFIRN